MVIACTIVRDVERGWEPWTLRQRWYGWKEPTWNDRVAVWDALNGGCDDIPRYRFVGNDRDYLHWQSIGMIDENTVVDWYGNGRVSAVR